MNEIEKEEKRLLNRSIDYLEFLRNQSNTPSEIAKFSIAIQTLKEKQERDEMRCENCKIDEQCCRNIYNNGHRPTDFCSRFELKEREENADTV